MVCQDIHYNGDKKIDNFIKEMQLKRSSHNDIIFEWISYNQFNDMKEISKGDLITIYSAIWKDGPLCYSNKNYERESNKNVVLKYLHNSQNITNEFLDEV